MKRRSVLTVGYLLPRLVFLAFLLDVSLRLVPREWLTPIGHNPYYRPVASQSFIEGVYEPNRTFPSYLVFGDLAWMGNLPAIRHYRRQAVQTDGLGYVNPPGPLNGGALDVIVVGDSFLVEFDGGVENSLTGRLGSMLGRPVYNAGRPGGGGVGPLPAKGILELASSLGIKRGAIVFEYYSLGEPGNSSKPPPPAAWKAAAQRFVHWQTTREMYYRVMRVDGFKTLSQFLLKPAQNGWLLSNKGADQVILKRLPNGTTMAFYRPDVEAGARGSRHMISIIAPYFQEMSRELDKAGLRLVVLILPTKYMTYANVFKEGSGVGDRFSDLDVLEGALHRSGIPVINMTRPFKQEAEARLKTDAYLYRLDDTHWSQSGIELTARALAETLRK